MFSFLGRSGMVAAVMHQLERLVALVLKTGLPAIIPGKEGREADCVLLPLEEYERLVDSLSTKLVKSVAESSVPQVSEEVVASLEAFQDPPDSNKIILDQPSVITLSLQDLLEPRLSSGTVSAATSTLSAISPQQNGVEDFVVFDGIETKILPKSRQKKSTESGALDEFGQTLA